MKWRLCAVWVCALALGGCATAEQGQTRREARIREWKLPCKIEKGEQHEGTGSLYLMGGGDGGTLFVDQRAWRVCDVLTVRISERSSAAGSASTEIARQTEVDARIDAFLGLMSKLESLNGRIDATNLVNAATEYTFKGEGKTRREGSLSAAVAVYVKHVLPQGNLYIEGSKTILVNDEEQYFYISGVVRQIDISPSNTIASELVSDLQVEFTGTGDVSDATEQGWLGRFFQWFWPF